MNIQTRSLLFGLLLVAAVSTPASAQNWEVGLDFMLGFPQGEFKQNVDAVGFGLDLTGLYLFSNAPFAAGLDLGVMTYGNTSRREPFNPNIPEVNIRVETSNNIAFGHFLFRIQPRGVPFRPYVDGLFGFNYLYTESKVQDEQTFEDIAGSNNFDDISVSGGIAAGAMIRLVDTTDPDSGNRISVFLNLRTRYLLGGDAEYLKEGSMRRENGNLVYDVERSRTDILTTQVGVVVQIF
ncbi:MAG: hypothetical protein WD355_07275 [Balneolaceae bacterium]